MEADDRPNEKTNTKSLFPAERMGSYNGTSYVGLKSEPAEDFSFTEDPRLGRSTEDTRPSRDAEEELTKN